MAYSKVASRYAKSLISLSQEQKNMDTVYSDMTGLDSICKSNKDLVVVLRSPIVKSDKKLAILENLFSGKFSKLTMAFLKIITTKKREFYLPEIAQQFIQQYKSFNSIVTANVTTSIPLTDGLRKQLIQVVKTVSMKELELVESVDKNITGGIIVRVGDQQIDASISSKIKNLKKSFSENLYIPKYRVGFG